MRGPFVIDASIGIVWIHAGQATELSDLLLERARNGDPMHVPALWRLEMANSLLVAVRRRLLTEAHRHAGLALLGGLRTIIDHEAGSLAFSTISEFAAKYMLSAYDAAYLELAFRASLPLATRDQALKAAAKKAGIKVL
jgi:predicted nucleic acid-binding protein